MRAFELWRETGEAVDERLLYPLGHGFKFTPAVGEIVADLVATGRSRFDLSMFRVDRF